MAGKLLVTGVAKISTGAFPPNGRVIETEYRVVADKVSDGFVAVVELKGEDALGDVRWNRIESNSPYTTAITDAILLDLAERAGKDNK